MCDIIDGVPVSCAAAGGGPSAWWPGCDLVGIKPQISALIAPGIYTLSRSLI